MGWKLHGRGKKKKTHICLIFIVIIRCGGWEVCEGVHLFSSTCRRVRNVYGTFKAIFHTYAMYNVVDLNGVIFRQDHYLYAW